MVEKVVLAYSGGLDTSVMVHWLAQTHEAEVVACMVDLGQDSQSLKEAEARALANGASEVVIPQARQAFAEGFVAPAIKANAVYEDAYPLATALARPLIAQKLVEAAQQTGADAIAHGCTGKGNDQVRIETSVKALDPSLVCLAPQRTDAMTRDQAIAYAQEHDLELPELSQGTYSVDQNLWGRSAEGDDLEDPNVAVPEAAYAWTTSPKQAPDEAATFTLTFAKGIPVALDGDALPLADLIASLNQQAGAHGIGRIDHVENRLVGIKSREVYEAPAAEVILTAKKALETLVLTRDLAHFKPVVEQKFSQLTYDGLWFSPTMQALQAFTEVVQQPVTGTVTLEAYKGSLTVTGRQAHASLYDEGLATYGPEDAFDHLAASGFIDLWSLPLATLAKTQGTAKPSQVTAETETETEATETPPLTPPAGGG